MNNILYLFRIKFIQTPNPQQSFNFENLTPMEAFKKALEEKPTVELREGTSWHIGNINYVDNNGICGTFKIGKKTVNSIPKFDSITKNFKDEVQETGPNCKVYFNLEYEILGISNKSSLCPDVFALAEKIKVLLENTATIKKSEKYIEISNIKNPETFVSRLRGAYRIQTFGVYFSGPNPFDTDTFFHKPMSAYLNAAGGEIGKTEITGRSLNSETLAIMAASVAATGNDAYAKIQETGSDKPITVRMNKNTSKISIPLDIQEDDVKILEMILAKYKEVRNNAAS